MSEYSELIDTKPEGEVILDGVGEGYTGGVMPKGTLYITHNGSYNVQSLATVNVIVPEPSGTISITTNGKHNIESYAFANVNVSGESRPTGTINITSNGTHNVYSYANANVNVPEPSGTTNITTNGTHDVKSYASANVNVPEPSGTINITTNGTHDVKSYASASVSVQGSVTPTGTKEIEIGSAETIIEDVTDYASVEITVPQGSVSASGTVTANPTISVNSDTGRITADVSTLRQFFFPTITEGWVNSASFNAKAVGTRSYDMGTEVAKTITPSTQTQRAISKGVFATGNIDVAPIPSQYVIPTGSQTITENGTVDVSALAEVVVNVSGGYDCDYGTFVPESDETVHTFTVSKSRKIIVIWTDVFQSVDNSLSWLIGNELYDSVVFNGAYGYTNGSNVISVTNGLSLSTSFGSTAIVIGPSNASRPFRTGVTYNWLAW